MDVPPAQNTPLSFPANKAHCKCELFEILDRRSDYGPVQSPPLTHRNPFPPLAIAFPPRIAPGTHVAGETLKNSLRAVLRLGLAETRSSARERARSFPNLRDPSASEQRDLTPRFHRVSIAFPSRFHRALSLRDRDEDESRNRLPETDSRKRSRNAETITA